MAGLRSILRQSLPLLLAMVVIEVVAGSFLDGMRTDLERLPGLLALIPAVLAMRGNIYASMAGRLGTAMRFGSLRGQGGRDPVIVHNVTAAMLLGLLMSFFAALLSHYTTRALGLPSAGVLSLTLIAVVSAVLSGLIMTGVALLVMRIAFRRGLDMDNIAGPVIMSTGDFFTLLSLLATVWLLGGVA